MNTIQLDCALHIANVVIREDAHNHAHDADRAHARLVALVDAQDDSDAFLVALARKLGKVRAAAVLIQPEVIALAMKQEA